MRKSSKSVSAAGRLLLMTGAALLLVIGSSGGSSGGSGGGLGAAQSSGRKRAKLAAKTRPAAPDPVLRLKPGEVLDFTVHFSKLNNVANIRIGVNGLKDFYGRSAWHLQAFAHTVNPLRMVFELDDQFDSYSDAATLASFQYELHLRERGQTVNAVLRMTTGAEPAPANATAARVLPGTRDPLGFLQFLRTTDWTKTKEVRGPVFDGHRLYDVRARLVAPTVSVQIPAGVFGASQIGLQVYENGKEMKDTRFTLSLANNAARTPVLLEAELPLGTARIELTRLQ
jgi:hypothetical protein